MDNKINKLYNQNKVNFQASKKDIELKDEERFNSLFLECAQEFLKEIDKRVPENGKFSPVGIAMEIAGTNNIAIFKIECDADDFKNQRRLSIGTRHEHKDRVFSNYLYKGSKQEISDYLQNEDNLNKIKQDVIKLSEKTDEFYSSL